MPERSVQVRVVLSLRPGEDDDLIAFFRSISQRRRSAALKSALRAGGMTASEAGEDDDELAEAAFEFFV